MRALEKAPLVAVAALAPAAALAHPGPDREEVVWSLAHILANPGHLLVISAGVAIALDSAALVALQTQR
jgi:hypothetical protein